MKNQSDLKHNVSNDSSDSSKFSIKKYLAPAIIAVYLTLGIFFCGWLLLDISTNTFSLLKWLSIELPVNLEYRSIFKLVSYSGIGGAIGGILFGMMNLQAHTTRGGFKIVFIGDYIFRPFGSAALAVVIYALIRGGIMTILGADPTSGSITLASNLSAFGIGFLAGFGSYKVIDKLNDLIENIFGNSAQ